MDVGLVYEVHKMFHKVNRPEQQTVLTSQYV
jgi:hypothetical protein